MNGRRKAELALVLTTLFWGITFPLIRLSVQTLSPEQFIAIRFTFAAILFLPLLLTRLGRPRDAAAARLADRPILARIRGEAWGGGVLGLLAWTTYQTQTMGLRTIAAGRAAFITGSCVLMVPMFSPLFGSGWPKPVDWIASLAAGAGLYFLTDPRGGGISSGDAWVFVCAVGCTIYIQYLQILSRTPRDTTALSFVQIATVSAIGIASLLVSGQRLPTVPAGGALSLGVSFVICALFATVGTFFLQTRFQGDTTAERAALIFALEPVFGCLFGYLVLGEILSVSGAFGAALILGSIIVSEGWKARAAATAGTGY